MRRIQALACDRYTCNNKRLKTESSAVGRMNSPRTDAEWVQFLHGRMDNVSLYCIILVRLLVIF